MSTYVLPWPDISLLRECIHAEGGTEGLSLSPIPGVFFKRFPIEMREFFSQTRSLRVFLSCSLPDPGVSFSFSGSPLGLV